MVVPLLPLLLSLLVRSLSTAGSISALHNRDLPKIRHKTFSFSRETEVKAVAERTVRSNNNNNRTKSVLEKLVREPQLGNTPLLLLILSLCVFLNILSHNVTEHHQVLKAL